MDTGEIPFLIFFLGEFESRHDFRTIGRGGVVTHRMDMSPALSLPLLPFPIPLFEILSGRIAFHFALAEYFLEAGVSAFFLDSFVERHRRRRGRDHDGQKRSEGGPDRK
jgi:hypothetical protein